MIRRNVEKKYFRGNWKKKSFFPRNKLPEFKATSQLGCLGFFLPLFATLSEKEEEGKKFSFVVKTAASSFFNV